MIIITWFILITLSLSLDLFTSKKYHVFIYLKLPKKIWFLCRYYSATIIKMSGVNDQQMAIWLAAMTAGINFLFTLVGVWLVERIGRKKLIMASLTGTGPWWWWLFKPHILWFSVRIFLLLIVFLFCYFLFNHTLGTAF